ncbi:MAG: hypothetical protein H0V17_06300 [Deltaproteobacteria bacterium]|nr:hypothetical protein [Deltaproteobacteria bacterium]
MRHSNEIATQAPPDEDREEPSAPALSRTPPGPTSRKLEVVKPAQPRVTSQTIAVVVEPTISRLQKPLLIAISVVVLGLASMLVITQL